jgi:hypothetical protein
MAVISKKEDLPTYAVQVAELVEKWGFRWTLDTEYPLPSTESRQLQVRLIEHVAPRENVLRYSQAYRNGAKFPPIVVSNDGVPIDGNTRTEAVRKLGWPFIQAIILQDNFIGAPTKTRSRMIGVATALNLANGQVINKEEIRNLVARIGDHPDFTIQRIAQMTGSTTTIVASAVNEKKGREVLREVLGKDVEAEELPAFRSAPVLAALGASAHRLTLPVLRTLVLLTRDAGLNASEVKAMVRSVLLHRTESERVEFINQERNGMSHRIDDYVATQRVGRGVPTPAQLRRVLGFIVNHDRPIIEYIETNPTYIADHRQIVGRAADILNKVRKGMGD